VRDRALDELGDLALAAGRGAEAIARYREIMARTLDEDALRTLEVKIAAADDERLRPGVVALLIGSGTRGPDRSMAMELLREVAVVDPEGGLPWYLLGKQYFNAGQYDEAASRLDRALAGSIEIGRTRVEAERLRMVIACATADHEGAAGFLAAYAAHPEVSRARRLAARQLVERCTGAAPAPDAYDGDSKQGM
jgi:tetratricopeptide (TPR) repeat protein